MTYETALAYLNGLEGRPWRNGLDRMQALVGAAGLEAALGNKGYIHIAGTNGKGTTTAFVESIFRHQGWRTGAFYSPYVVDYRERIQTDGRLIAKEELAALLARLEPAVNAVSQTAIGGVTKFELEAAMGIAYWEEKGCEWVALEVGLGGRLDATNVVQPRTCAIVSIGLDHTGILGDAIEAIATEKAGIVKPHVPVIVGEMPDPAADAIASIAEKRNAPLWRVGTEIRYGLTDEGWTVDCPSGSVRGLNPSLGGAKTPHNMAIAVAACFAAGAVREAGAVIEGVKAAWLPGRYEVRSVEGREVVFDGAHNADAARALVASLGERPFRLITNMIGGHEVEPFYRALASTAVGAEVAPILSPRALAVDDAVEHIRAVGIPARGHASVGDALDAARSAGEETILVTGSNYLVGEALRLLR